MAKPKINTPEQEIFRRRRLLSEIMVSQQDHGMTLQEIALKLSEGKTRINADGDLEVDPSTYTRAASGKPWSTATISLDREAIREDWRKQATAAVSEHKQEILAQYQRLLEIHWSNMDTAGIQSVLKEIRALLGTDTERIAIWEGIREAMDIAAKRLRQEFGNEPEILRRAYAALSGKVTDLKSLSA